MLMTGTIAALASSSSIAPPIASAATPPNAVKPCRCHRMSGPSWIHPEIDCHCTDQPWASSSLRSGRALGAARPEPPPFPARSGAGSDLTSNDRFMCRSWRREPGALRYGAPLLPGARYEGWGRGGLCRGAKRRTPLELFHVGIERVFPRTKPARCCPECCPNLAGDDQRVRSFPPNPLILLAPRAGLEPATKRLTVGCFKKGCHTVILRRPSLNKRFGRKQRAAASSAVAPSGSPLTLPPHQIIRMF